MRYLKWSAIDLPPKLQLLGMAEKHHAVRQVVRRHVETMHLDEEID